MKATRIDCLCAGAGQRLCQRRLLPQFELAFYCRAMGDTQVPIDRFQRRADIYAKTASDAPYVAHRLGSHTKAQRPRRQNYQLARSEAA